MAPLYGVDVSEAQGQINWDALNAVSNFAVIRSCFGTGRKDHQFDRNKSEAHRVQAAAGRSASATTTMPTPSTTPPRPKPPTSRVT
jgi:GH25 family lysozyme M1 (1,4-beta-N-acetylmuramidase)